MGETCGRKVEWPPRNRITTLNKNINMLRINRIFRRRIRVFAVSVAFTCFLLCEPSPAAETTAPSLANVVENLQSGDSPVRIVCFGDSITGVYYHTGSQRAWCDMLGIALKRAYPAAQIEMINAGISGHTTVNALARIDKDVVAKRPHLVVVMFGMNDITRVKPDVFEKNTATIVRKCQAAGAAVVLCTPNSVIENPSRPNAGLKDLARRVQRVAKDVQLPLVDVFEQWQAIRDKDEIGWALLMSDTIHPNMNGHKRFAQMITKTVSGKDVTVDDVAPPTDALRTTFKVLAQGKPLKLVAMPPYDKLVPEILRVRFPEARFQVTAWPTTGQSIAQLTAWGKRIRGMAPHLVVVAVPSSADDETKAAYIRNYEWVLNWSFHFGTRAWDVLPILPTVTGPVADGERERLTLARRIVIGKDVEFIDRPVGNSQSTREILSEWISSRKK